MLYSPHVYYSDDQIKDDEMSKGIWSIYGRKEMLSWIEQENLRETDHFEDLGVDWKIILFEIDCKDIGWQGDWDKWWALVNVVMHLRVP